MSKRRVKLTLDESEAAVVAPVEFWDHLRSVYVAFADDPTYRSSREDWVAAANLISYWVSETKASLDDEEF